MDGKIDDLIAYARKRLEESKRPMFIFDSDADGASAFLLLYRLKHEGKGLISKKGKSADEGWIQTVHDYGPDLIFVLDMQVSQDFLDNMTSEVIWIDHHAQTEQVSSPRLTVINPLLEEMPPWPTSYWAYQVVKREV
ncbi:MAG: DHH family phosphoesterase, partial [Candidatus Woesearchaeota archaeon]